MRVKFLQDYRGVLTGEQFFRAGDIRAFPAEQARALIEAGRAEAVAGADARTAPGIKGAGPKKARRLTEGTKRGSK